MKRGKIYLGLIVIFLAGVTGGVVGTHLFMRPPFDRMDQEDDIAVRDHIMARLTRELKLTEEQRGPIGEVVLQVHRELKKLRWKHFQEDAGIFQRELEQMKPHLTAVQQQKLEAMHNEARRRFGPPGKRKECDK